MKNPMEKPFRLFQSLTVGAILLAGVALPFGFVGQIVAIISGILGLVMGLIALLMAYYRRKFARQISALEQGEFLAHWVYPSDFWQRFLDAERVRPPEGSLTMFVGIFGAIGGLIGVALWFGDVRIEGHRWVAPAACALAGAAMGVLVFLLSVAMTQSKFRRLEQSDPEAYIGREGLYFASNYLPWGMLGQSLESLAFREGEIALLEFTYRITGGETDTTDVVRVPVPPGEEPQARRIAAALGGG